MNTRLVNTAADVILAALTQNRTAAGIALALESACMLQSPETAAEHARLQEQVTELEAAAYGDSKARLLTPVEMVRFLHSALAAQKDRADTVDRLCREKQDRIVELEQLLATKDRPVDEFPIRYSLTDKAEAVVIDDEVCDHPNGYGPYGCAGCGAFMPADDDVRPQVAKLRALLAGQRAAVEDPHDSPLHHDYRVSRDLPVAGGDA